MPNNASVVKPTPGNVQAGAAIAGIQVDASGTDTVDPASSDIGTVSGGVYTQQAGLKSTATANIYEPDANVVAPNGLFKIRANVQFTSGGMPSQNLQASHNGDFNGQAYGKGHGKGKPKKTAGKSAKPESKRAPAKPAKGGKRGAKKSRSAAKPAAKAKGRSAAKKARPAAKKPTGKAKRKK